MDCVKSQSVVFLDRIYRACPQALRASVAGGLLDGKDLWPGDFF